MPCWGFPIDLLIRPEAAFNAIAKPLLKWYKSA